MPALVASSSNPDLKAKYDHLKTTGKAPKVAVAAIMRKLIVLANALLKNYRKWNTENRLIKTDALAGKVSVAKCLRAMRSKYIFLHSHI